MEPKFELVYTVTEYYDGPRDGVANFRDAPHVYRSVYLDHAQWDRNEDRFELGSRVVSRVIKRIFARNPRGVRVIEPKIDEVRLRVSAQEIERAIDHPGGAFPTFDFVARRPYPIRRRDIRMWLRAFVSAEADIVTVRREGRGISDVASAAEMPLSNVGGAVTRFF